MGLDLKNRLIISAPFGNHFDAGEESIRTYGTYTAKYRASALWRWWKVLSTVRYYRRLGAWVNKLGLPNVGINEFYEECQRRRISLWPSVKKSILSIKGFDRAEWWDLLCRCVEIRPAAVELNMSCPNVHDDIEMSDVHWLFEEFRKFEERYDITVIVKLPPVDYQGLWRAAEDEGLRRFHCCNTLPVPVGGMSGKPLKPLSLQVVRALKNRSSHALTIIGGGGITETQDAKDYVEAGANSVSMASALFFRSGRETARYLAPRVKMITQAVREGIDHYV